MGSLRVGHDWVTSLSLFTFMHWRRKWQPTPVFLPGESQGWGSLLGCRLWGRTESDTTEVTEQQQQQCILYACVFPHCLLLKCHPDPKPSLKCCVFRLAVPNFSRWKKFFFSFLLSYLTLYCYGSTYHILPHALCIQIINYIFYQFYQDKNLHVIKYTHCNCVVWGVDKGVPHPTTNSIKM